MKIVTIGDSITRGTFTDIGEKAPLSVASPNYSERLGVLLNAEVTCRGINGISYSSISPINSQYAVAATAASVFGFDMIIVAAGTNDYGTDVRLGSLSDITDVSFYGALSVAFSTLLKNNPDARIFAVTPVKRMGETHKNGAGFTLDDYRNAITERAEKLGITVIDGKKLAIDPDDENDRLRYIPDGLHPNNAGHELYANMLYKKITETIKC